MNTFFYSNLFERNTTKINQYLSYEKRIKFFLNLSSFKKPFINIKKFFSIDEYDLYIIYSFKLIKEWINNNEIYSENYISSLEDNIKKIGIFNLLNTREIEYINHFKSVVFNKKRNLKALIIDFPLNKDLELKKNKSEIFYFYFENSFLFDLDSFGKKISLFNGQVYLSNFRIVFSTSFFIISFYYEDIKKYKINNDYFEFEIFQIKYRIKSFDNYVFYVSFERAKKIWDSYELL